MKFARLLLIGTILMVFVGLANGGPETAESPAALIPGDGPADQLHVPEPNMMLFAGIGGFIILLFAIRRK
jgi:hypothetical protein